MEFYDLHTRTKSIDINLIFPQWETDSERVVIFSPHDDDVILGAAYILLAILANTGEVYIVIFNDGSAGYTKPELKDKIVEIRREETYSALQQLGIEKQQIIRFEIPDYTGLHYLGWKLPWIKTDDEKNEGLFSKVVTTLRKINATRLIFPNGYREHIDHTAACLSAMFDGPQVGDAVVTDYGEPSKIKTYLQYSVWGKLSPEDALINKRNIEIRANRAIVVEKGIEQKIIDSLKEFKSQEDIISYILDVRKERKLENEKKFIELYLEVDPRPRFDYGPYKKLILDIDK
jgi:LmbE family N-acetylglucosaminyl deacetylase